MMRKAFTLVELLVVVSILALLVSVLLPAMGKAREQAKVTTVNAELYQIGLALEAYGLDHRQDYPPTRESCMDAEHYHQLPDELVKGKYLPPRPTQYGPMSSGFEDRYNPRHTYKYVAPGGLIVNNNPNVLENESRLWVPDGFPDVVSETGRMYKKREESPVAWVVFSLGPKFDPQDKFVQDMEYPVPKQRWYDPARRKGFLTRIRLTKSQRHVGTFERRR